MIGKNLHYFQNPGLIIFSFAVALSFGLSYGSGNHNTYLLGGMLRLDPDFLAGDWLAHQTIQYHSFFSYLVWGLESIGLPEGYASIAFDVILKCVFLRYVYKLTKICSGPLAAVSFLGVMVLVVFGGTKSVAGSYLFSDILQPSSLGAIFTFIGICYFVEGRYFWSGVALSVAGLFHTNFLLLSFIIFGLAHIALGRSAFERRCFHQFMPMVLIFFLELPFLIEMISATDAGFATSIFQFIRSPHHYAPNTFLFEFTLFAGWVVIGTFSLYQLPIDYKYKNPILYIYLSMVVMLILSTALTTWVFIPWVSKLFFWRFAPYVDLIGQILFSSLLAKYLLTNSGIKVKKPYFSFSVLLLGEALILWWAKTEYGFKSFTFIALFVFFVHTWITILQNYFLSKSLANKVPDKLIKIYLANILFVSLFVNLEGVFSRSTALNMFPGVQAKEMYSWVRSQPKGTTFLIPPNLDNFRLQGQRPIVVDWKSTPIDPEGLLEWYRRIEDISGIKDVASKAEAIAGYEAMDEFRLQALKLKYDVDYVVLKNSDALRFRHLATSYEDSEFSILKLPQ